MEKFRIAQYGFIQMVALAYAILCTGILDKARRVLAERGEMEAAPDFLKYKIIFFYHDYGIFLSLIIVAWAVICAYHSSIFSNWNLEVDEQKIVISGLVLTAFFLLSGTALFLCGIVALFSPIQ
jgi:hypothetical protein